ncbi:hypothetical protein L195_g063817, partial [Trifolium pratense]
KAMKFLQMEAAQGVVMSDQVLPQEIQHHGGSGAG